MKNFSFSFEALETFSNSDPYSCVPAHCRNLFSELKRRERELRFPAIKNDVGSMLGFLLSLTEGKRVFEMGSGYGQSAFWYFAGNEASLERVVLTEKRQDLLSVFEALPWPMSWKQRMVYHQGDAFEKLRSEEGEFDLFLVDGVKADYKKFVEAAVPKLSAKGLIAIDNSYWRGSFLNPELRTRKQSAANIHELHSWIKGQSGLSAVFVPYTDGLTLLKKK